MKPGLRRFAAIILSAATMLGGGTLAAGTAMADDTGTPTQIQTQATVTTDGQNTGTGTQAETQADATPNTDAPTTHADTSVKAANPNNAAKDVTIHDMLDTDSASITKLKLTSRLTGTAPFDNDNERGDDKDAANDIVRSFDDVIYDYEYTVTPDSTMDYYKRTRVGFRFELPYPKDKVTFDTSQMGWVDQTPGYEPKTTTETVNGVQTQVYTCYRLLEPTSNNPTVNPGTSAISLAVAVKGAPHGYKFHPTVKSWTAWDAGNPTNTGTHKAMTDTPQDVTVSAKLSLNVRMSNSGNKESSNNQTWDFGKATGYTNSELGKQKGILTSYNFSIDTRWKDRTKGLKGIELPTGDISFDFRISNVYRDDGSTKPHDSEEGLQPYFWDVASIGKPSNTTSNKGRNTSPDWIPRDDNYAYAYGTHDLWDGGVPVASNQRTYDNGTYTVTQKRDKDGAMFHVVLKDYSIDGNQFPTKTASQSPKNYSLSCVPGMFMDDSCTEMQVGEISVGTFMFFTPTIIKGQKVTDYYKHDVTLLSNITDMNLSATSVTGDKLPADSGTGNQAMSDDDRLDMTTMLRLPGKFIQRIHFGCLSKPVINDGTDCAGYAGQDAKSGTDSLTQGATARIMSGFNYTTDIEELPVMGLNLIKWDTNVFEATADTAKSDEYGSFRYQMGKFTASVKPLFWYAVKKDGTSWKSDDEQRKAGYDDLDYYQSYDEAKQHGIIVGALLGTRDAANVVTAGKDRNSFLSGRPVDVKVRADAKIGSVGQITGFAATWKRSQLKDAGIVSIDPSDTTQAWKDWASKQNPWDLYQKVKPQFKYGSSTYIKATYDENGNYQGGDTGGSDCGDSMVVVGERPSVGKTVAQKNEAGSVKTVYDLDKEQRYVDWDLRVKAVTGSNSTGASYPDTDLYVVDTLPKGMTYTDGSAYLDGEYSEQSGGQEPGNVTNGTAIAPNVTRNDDGTTTLKWTVNGVKADGSLHHIRFSASIGDASDPENDAKNGQEYINRVEITSKRNGAKPNKALGTIATATVRVSRTHSSSLATRADPLLNEVEKPLGFRNMLGNFSTSEKTDPYAVDVMPYKGDGSLSGYHGSYTLTGLKASGVNGASLTNMHVYFTNDVKWRGVSAEKITRQQVQSWTEAKLDKTTGKVAIPDGYDKPVAWAFTSDRLPANARYDFALDISPTGNKASDVYANRWADGDNKVDALTQVVERKVNGVAWFDVNHNGVREDTDTLLPDVTVTLIDSKGDTVTGMDGKPCETVTDRNGWYEITGIPSGSGYKLRFTPKKGISWVGLHVTVKNSKEASEATDSDSDQENDANGHMVAGVIPLKDFPALDKMSAALYEDANEDHGMYGTLKPSAPVTFKAVKVLDGRPNGAWTDKDRYVADIAPVGDAPKDAVPSTIEFTDNKTHTIDIDGSKFPKEGVYQYRVSERKGDNPGVTYDSSEWLLTVTVKDDPATLERRMTANVSRDGVQSDTIQFTNTYAPKDTQVELQATKRFDNGGDASVKLTDFQFDLYANADGTGTPIQTVNADAEGKVRFAPLLFTKAKMNGRDSATFRYSIRERDTNAGGVEYDKHVAQYTVHVTDDNNGQLKASLTIPPTNTTDNHGGLFVNTYHTQPASVTPTARKVLANPSNTRRTLAAGEFGFELQDKDGRTLQAKTNKADGTVTFDKIQYSTTGEHDYRMVEKQGTANGIVYDKTVHLMHVKVTDDGQGRLKAETTYDGGKAAPTFTNTYQPKDATVQLRARKTFDGGKASHAKLTDFQFQLFDNGQGTGTPLQTVNADENGDILFNPLTFTASQLEGQQSKTFTYTVREVGQSAGGVEYDTHKGMWTVTVSDDGKGQLKAVTTESPENPVTFSNRYKAKPVSVQFRAHKTLNDPGHTGITLKGGEFQFDCTDDETGTKVGGVKTNDGQGNVLFDALTYTTAGTHSYTISERNTGRGGVEYDMAKHHAKVVVSDDGEGRLQAETTYDNGTGVPEFANTYKAQAAYDQPTAKKTVTASKGNRYTLKGDDFAFTLHQQSAPANVQNADQTKRNDRNGDIRFDRLTFTVPGTYVYTVTEQDTDVPGITKDGTVATITYKVEDKDHAGTLSIASKTVKQTNGGNGKTVTFDNRYNPRNVGYSIGGVKNIVNTDTATSRTPVDGEFEFRLDAISATGLDGTPFDNSEIPMPEGSGDGSKTVTNRGTGFDFGNMEYSKTGVYKYHVSEVAGKDKTIAYSTQEYDVTVTVTDHDGILAATADRQPTEIRFDNTYTPTPANIQVKAMKHLTGRALNGGEFSAELKDADGNTLQTKTFDHVDDTDGGGNADEGTGELRFDRLAFDRTGVYTYTIDEQAGTLGGITYDPTVHTVTVTVTEDTKTHALSASAAYSDGNGSEEVPTFHNTYKPADVKVALTAKKTMSGRALKEGEFEFELADSHGTVIDTERNDAEGNVRFNPIAYRRGGGVDARGVHRYVIREKDTGERNVTYDKTEHHATVIVRDDLQGHLTAEVRYDPTDTATKDYSAMLADATGEPDGDADPTKVVGTRPEFVNSYIAPATPAIVKTIRQLANTGATTPIAAVAVFTLLGAGLAVAYAARKRHAATPRHGR